MSAARSAAFRTPARSRWCAPGSSLSRARNSVRPRITVIMLLISCAIPPASCPATSRRCTCCTRSSAERCLVTSVSTHTAWRGGPSPWLIPWAVTRIHRPSTVSSVACGGWPSGPIRNGGSGRARSPGTRSASARPAMALDPMKVAKASFQRVTRAWSSTTQTPSVIAWNVARQASPAAIASASAARARIRDRMLANSTTGSTGWVR